MYPGGPVSYIFSTHLCVMFETGYPNPVVSASSYHEIILFICILWRISEILSIKHFETVLAENNSHLCTNIIVVCVTVDFNIYYFNIIF